MASQFFLSVAAGYLRRFPLESGKWRVAQFLRRRLAQKPFRGIVPVTGGLSMELDTSDFLQREIYIHRDFEPAIRSAIQKRLKPGDAFLDVGANVGFFSLCASKAVGPGGSVYAFEPAPKTYKSLCRNLELNGLANVTALPLALSDSAGQSKLFMDAKNNSGASSLRQSPHSGDAVDVELDRYDHFSGKKGLPVPALVKIDVEGAEVKVLRGMQALLSRPDRPTVILEVSELSLRQMESSKEELFELMVGHGYKASLLSTPRVSIFSDDNIFFQYDVLFVPGGRN